MRFLLLFFALLHVSFVQEKVLICKSGTAYAYHKGMCRGLKECTHTIGEVSLAEALRQSRTPCGYCYDTAPAGLPVKRGGEASVQCKAITKSNSRCSRKATSNGFCLQHDK